MSSIKFIYCCFQCTGLVPNAYSMHHTACIKQQPLPLIDGAALCCVIEETHTVIYLSSIFDSLIHLLAAIGH